MAKVLTMFFIKVSVVSSTEMCYLLYSEKRARQQCSIIYLPLIAVMLRVCESGSTLQPTRLDATLCMHITTKYKIEDNNLPSTYNPNNHTTHKITIYHATHAHQYNHHGPSSPAAAACAQTQMHACTLLRESESTSYARAVARALGGCTLVYIL